MEHRDVRRIGQGRGAPRRGRHRSRVAAYGLALALAAGPGFGAAQAVYRCDDGRGGVLYSDIPCKDGARVDVLPGKADPAAIERLQREQRAFDERQAAREARAKQEADALREYRRAQREAQRDAEPRYGSGPDWYYWGGVWPWPVVPVVPPPPPLRPRPDKPMPVPSVPAHPGLGRPSPPPAAKPLPPLPPPGGRGAPMERG